MGQPAAMHGIGPLRNSSHQPVKSCGSPPGGSCSITAPPYNAPFSAACATGCGDTPFGFTVDLVDVTVCDAGCYDYDSSPFGSHASTEIIGDFRPPVSESVCYTRGHEYAACGTFPGGWLWASDPSPIPTCTWNGQWPVDACGGLWPATVRQYSGHGCNPGNLVSTSYGFTRLLTTQWDSITGLMTVELMIGTGGSSTTDHLTIYPSNMFYGLTQFTPADVSTRCYFSTLIIENQLTDCFMDGNMYAHGGQAEVNVCCREGVPLGLMAAAAPLSVNRGPIIAEPRVSADGDKWGPPLWRDIHQRPQSPAWEPGRPDFEFLRGIARRLPCGACRVHWLSVVQKVRWDFSSRRGYFASTVEAHNMVNRAIGKPDVAVAEAAVLHGFAG
jgi:hypothetical protein